MTAVGGTQRRRRIRRSRRSLQSFGLDQAGRRWLAVGERSSGVVTSMGAGPTQRVDGAAMISARAGAMGERSWSGPCRTALVLAGWQSVLSSVAPPRSTPAIACAPAWCRSSRQSAEHHAAGWASTKAARATRTKPRERRTRGIDGEANRRPGSAHRRRQLGGPPFVPGSARSTVPTRRSSSSGVNGFSRSGPNAIDSVYPEMNRIGTPGRAA